MRRNYPIVAQTGHRRPRIADDVLRSSDPSETHFDSHIWGTRAQDHGAGAVVELIDDPSRISDLLRAASCTDRSLRVQVGCDVIIATPAAIGNSSVVWRVAPHRDTLPDTLRGILDGYISCYELTLAGVRPSPEGFVSALPASLRRNRRRCEPRARCAATPVARWGRDGEALVLSLSNGGLAIHVVGGDPPAACDFALAHRGESVRLRALRRWQEPVVDGMLAGYRVRPLAADATRWRAMVADELHPSTSAARTAAADVWSLYEESGYLRLSGKQPGEFGPVAEAGGRADNTPADSVIVNDALRRIGNVRPRAYVEALDLTPDFVDEATALRASGQGCTSWDSTRRS
jgi:hypothetical protein